MGAIVMLAFFVALTLCSLLRLWVVDSRDGKDWQPTEWPTRRF